MKGSTELRPAVRSGAGNRIPGFFRKLLAVSLVLALAACVSGREKLAGPDVRSLPTAMVKVLSTAPLAEVHDVVSGSNTVRVLVESSADWQWSSLAIRQGIEKDGLSLHAGPIPLPDKWLGLVDLLPNEADLEKLENCIRRGSPYGSDMWTVRMAERLDLTSTLRPRGRPKLVEMN